MKYRPSLPARFPERLAVHVPRDVREATLRAAEKRGLTASDYVRWALADRLMQDGERFEQFPVLGVDRLDGLGDDAGEIRMQLANDARQYGRDTAEHVMAALTDLTLSPDQVNAVAERAATVLALGSIGISNEHGASAAAEWRVAAHRAFTDRIAVARRTFFQLEPGGVAA